MQILLRKLTRDLHSLCVIRRDGSSESRTLNSRSFLRHDLAHYAVEAELPIHAGYWGSVARGASLSGEGLQGPDIELAESLAGPVQTLMRLNAEPMQYLKMLYRVQPECASASFALRLHDRVRQLNGHWQGTPYGSTMCIEWFDA